MRRILPLFCTLFLLVCAQSAGLVHGIGHRAAGPAGAQAAATGASALPAVGDVQTRDPEGGLSCQKCFEFAHVASGGVPSLPAFLLAATVDVVARGPQAALMYRDAPASRSRGPPAFL